MGSRYLFIVLLRFLEHHLTRGDYRRRAAGQRLRRGPRPHALASADRTLTTATP